MDKKEREARRHQEDHALNCGLCWAAGAVVLEFLLLTLKRHYINFAVDNTSINIALAMDKVLRVVRMAAPAALVAGLIWMVLNAKKQKKTAIPVVLSVVSAVLWTCAHSVLRFNASGLRMLLLLVPVLGGLALVYYIYQKEFFLAALVGVLGGVGLWFVRSAGGFCLESNLALAVICLVVLFTAMLKKGKGLCPLSKHPFLPEDTNYLPVGLTALVSVAVMVLALVIGSSAAYYLTYLMMAWLFALLVYYTVKLM